MGLLSFLFSSDPKKEIEKIKESIENTKRVIEGYKRNIEGYKRNNSPKHYIEGTLKNIQTQKYLIKKNQEKIKALKKKLKQKN
ncbi:hypothetical protein J2Q11_11590 [Tenacibaculum finnmarkense genomovar finnmarkense]|uniref:hypothetical protein n=1 Tax=Tenacibaculum finnmarkense TaxID=2781243 RepID=UPI001EFAA869|nr:hypothetical protein [Tenacibaculum finnmarkense]MCG8213458.1 hypothetical protein [Tenacibaculum finnmarkense genomovar finnmarkense]MCG8231771.1 hypothetical protein [Tenacibaculum finnmarkense genomovar finnmarkense]MCG8242115.1 hypothetical protein [Tenacibaculum finnmarkense genomovar finnmarkense]MCG8718901.1 hypothetical protein [Tenacibaculum finnmarkense]MCG8726644.1 hypothetical protein [Tenacibaculum finnmarkense]